MASHDKSAGFLRETQIIGSRRKPQQPRLVPIDHSTLWRWVKQGRFPQPVKLGPNITAWSAQSVHDWIEQKAGAL